MGGGVLMSETPLYQEEAAEAAHTRARSEAEHRGPLHLSETLRPAPYALRPTPYAPRHEP